MAPKPARPSHLERTMRSSLIQLFATIVLFGAASCTARGEEPVWWSFRKLERPPVPATKDTAWPKNAVDAFVLAKLEQEGLPHAGPADRRILIRRAYFDLIGLPPDPDRVEQFVNASSPNAYAKLIDRLLASPQYGVRWGRHWLDVARYADTSDGPDRFPFSYTYRDWVINAFNQDMPFDQFAKRQIAADQLEPLDKSDLAALGFITLGRSIPTGEHDMIDD